MVVPSLADTKHLPLFPHWAPEGRLLHGVTLGGWITCSQKVPETNALLMIISPFTLKAVIGTTNESFCNVVTNENKKVLLRERKRHTARRVASTPYVVLTGYPPRQGTPLPGYPLAGYPPGRTWQGTPPPGGCPMAFWEMLQSIMGYGYPPPGVDKLTKWNYYLPVILRTRAVKIM